MLSRWNDRLKNHRSAAAAALLLFTVATYAGALRNTFVYDDEPQIIANPFVYNSQLWARIFTGSVWSFSSATATDIFYRPLQIFYYWLLYRAAGPNPAAFHLVQVLVYAASAVVIYRLGCEVFEHECAALLGAGLWIVHPLHVEAVAWISGMPDAGAGFFYLLAFLLFVRAEKSQQPRVTSHLMAALVYLPSLLFKEMALTFPLLVLTYWFFVPQVRPASVGHKWAGRIERLVPYLVAVGAYMAVRLTVLGRLGKSKALLDVSAQVATAAFGLLGQHARLFIWPVGLSPFRTLHLESALRSPWPWIALVTLLAALVLRKQDRPMSFLVAWWAVTLIACLDVRELSVPQVADRFSYLPSVGPCLAIALALLARLPARAPTALTVAVPALALLTVFWGFETVTDIPHWRDSLSLIQNGLARAPDNPSIHNVRGNYLRFLNHDLDGAEREYKMALSLDEKATVKSEQLKYDSYFGLGGVAQERGEDEQALAYYHRAAEIMPNVSPAFDALGAYYFPRHDYITASQYFARAVTANPMDVVAHIYMANCWMKLKKFGPAAEEFRAARMVDPSLKQAYWGEARALDAMGDHDGSAKVRAQYRE